MFMTESGPRVKKPKKLKAYVFDISPYAYGSGVVVVTAYTKKQAQKIVAKETGRDIESLRAPDVIELDTPRFVAYSYHAS